MINFRELVALIPDWCSDATVVGKIVGVTIYAKDIRELAKVPSSIDVDDEQILAHIRAGNRIQGIKHRRTVTGEGLKEAKDYCDELGIRHGILVRRSGKYGGSEIVGYLDGRSQW